MKFLLEKPARFQLCQEWFDLSQGVSHPIIGCLQELHVLAVGDTEQYQELQATSYWKASHALVSLECSELVCLPVQKALLRDLAKMLNFPEGSADLTQAVFVELSSETLGIAPAADPQNHFDENMDIALMKQYARIIASHVKKSSLPHLAAILQHVKSKTDNQSKEEMEVKQPDQAKVTGPSVEKPDQVYAVGDLVRTKSRKAKYNDMKGEVVKVLKSNVRVKLDSGEVKDFPMTSVAMWVDPAPAGSGGRKRTAEDAELKSPDLTQKLFENLSDL